MVGRRPTLQSFRPLWWAGMPTLRLFIHYFPFIFFRQPENRFVRYGGLTRPPYNEFAFWWVEDPPYELLIQIRRQIFATADIFAADKHLWHRGFTRSRTNRNRSCITT